MQSPFTVFLVLYLIIGIITILVVKQWIKQIELSNRPLKWDMTDPYEIAYLQCRKNIAWDRDIFRIALIALLDRKLIQQEEGKIQAILIEQSTLIDHPVEKAVYESLPMDVPLSEKDAYQMSRQKLVQACGGYESSLQMKGLLANQQTFSCRKGIILKGSLFLFLLAGLCFFLLAGSSAYSGTGILYILFLSVAYSSFFIIPLIMEYYKEETYLTKPFLEDLKKLWKPLKTERLNLNEDTQKLTMLAALFGISLVATQFPFMQSLFSDLFPVTEKTNGKSNAGDGGGCGGDGGCGGGCGGCGGCGG